MLKLLEYKKTFSFVVVFLLILVYNFSIKNHMFYYDAGAYWELGRKFAASGKFSWLTYDNSLRGYILPFISYCCITLSKMIGISEISFFNIASAVFFSFFFTVLLPSFYEKLTNKLVGIIPILFFSTLMFYFWRGYFLYPLSDFMSLFFLMMAMYNLISYFHKQNYLHMLSLGFFIALSTLSRPSYQIVIVPIIILFLVHSFKTKEYRKYLPLSIIAILLSATIAYSPQIYINAKVFNQNSPFVQTQINNKVNLYTQQLFWGMHTQRYETNVNPQIYPNASVFLQDRVGTVILSKSKIKPDDYSLVGYLSVVLKYPLDFIFLYFRHLFNGLDNAYPTVYITNLYDHRILFSLLNYSLWYIACYQLIRYFKTVSFKEKYFQITSVMVILMPSVLSIPTALEIRFFLPFYFLSYVIFSFHLMSQKINFKNFKTDIPKFIPSYLLFVLICFVLSQNTFSTIGYMFNN